MKKVKLISCMVLSIIIILILVIYDRRPSAVIAIENDGLVMRLDCSEGHQETLKAWYQETDGCYHFFLPAYAEEFKSIEVEGKKEKYSLEEEIFFAGNNVRVHRSSKLPAVFIDTETANNDMLHGDKERKEAAELQIINSEGEFLYNDAIDYITGRGNSTWNFEKKPYTLKLNNDVSLLGMKPGDKWVLLANAYEGSKISYKMVLDMAEYMGLEYTPEAEWVDLYLNGEYRGNYLLCKAVYIGAGSVNISNKGVLLEKDFPEYYQKEENGFMINDNLTFSIKGPADITREKIADLTEYFTQVDTLLREGDKAYESYIDIASMIDIFLIDELSYKSDSGITSAFMYIKPDTEHIMFGPAWDYDGSFGESNGEWLDYEGSVLDIKESSRGHMYLDWVNLLYENDEEFLKQLVNRYEEIKPYLQYLLESGIDQYADEIAASVRMDMLRWDYGDDTAGHYSTFENNVRFLKYFLSRRISTLNTRWGLETKEEFSVGNGKIHNVIFDNDGIVYEELVEDGGFLQQVPRIEGIIWRYSRDEQRYSKYLPIFEDTLLISDEE